MPTILYLVSALETREDACRRFERFGGWTERLAYWKVGITNKRDPLRRDPKRYQEVFRAVEFADEIWTQDLIDHYNNCGISPHSMASVTPGDIYRSGKERAGFVEWYVRRAFNQIATPVGLESLDIRAPLQSVLDLFDQMVSWDATGELCYVDPDKTIKDHLEIAERFGTVCNRSEFIPLWERLDDLIDGLLSEIERSPAHPENADMGFQPMWD